MIKWFMGLSRHLRIAIILAPFLGVFGFGLADTWLKKDQPDPFSPQAAIYELDLVGRCVLDSASCLLSKEALTIMLRSAPASNGDLLRIDIGANAHIRGLKLALVQDSSEEKLVPQRTAKTDHWFAEFPRQLVKQSGFTLRLALAQTQRVYLAEFPAQFN